MITRIDLTPFTGNRVYADASVVAFPTADA